MSLLLPLLLPLLRQNLACAAVLLPIRVAAQLAAIKAGGGGGKAQTLQAGASDSQPNKTTTPNLISG